LEDDRRDIFGVTTNPIWRRSRGTRTSSSQIHCHDPHRTIDDLRHWPIGPCVGCDPMDRYERRCPWLRWPFERPNVGISNSE
jgi:hypothetical protein